MARSNITDRTIQLNSDDGAVLWSIVQGEQREFLLRIESLENINGYTFKAIVVEAENNLNTAAIPKKVKAGGVSSELEIRVPVFRGALDPVATYVYDDVITYSGITYRKISATPLLGSATEPSTDTTNWEEYVHNAIYIRFDKTFADLWVPQPNPVRSVYGFFEFSVTEPVNGLEYVQTYKPIRGLVESVFSPTDLEVI
jgi:hypothetical protein